MSVNTWPGLDKHAMTQSEHESWNASNRPGTRQVCSECGEPTGKCEDDSLLSKDVEPLCDSCHDDLAKGR